MPVTRIISGAQTGADQGGLDAAIRLGLMTGGWIPKGRRTEQGPLDIHKFKLYRLQEHSSWAYPARTRQNVLDSDGTVLFGNMASPGCRLTIKYCIEHNKPYFIVKLDTHASELREWLQAYNISTVNTAGNREESNPGIHDFTMNFWLATLS